MGEGGWRRATSQLSHALGWEVEMMGENYRRLEVAIVRLLRTGKRYRPETESWKAGTRRLREREVMVTGSETMQPFVPVAEMQQGRGIRVPPSPNRPALKVNKGPSANTASRAQQLLPATSLSNQHQHQSPLHPSGIFKAIATANQTSASHPHETPGNRGSSHGKPA